MSKPDLEWWILFGICVAGKGAKQTQEKLKKFLDAGVACRWTDECAHSPFARVRFFITNKQLGWRLRHFKIGQYKRINMAFRLAVNLDLDNITIEALESIPGIGPKTARMVAMYGFPDTCGEVAVLDTHILKWLRLMGYNAPKSTPSGRKYRDLEVAFLAEAKKAGKSPAELDTEIWQAYAIKPGFTDSYEQSA